MANRIVTVNVSQQIAPAPSTLQRTGAMISQGATTAASGSTSLITQMSDLTAILKASFVLTTMTWASGVATVVTTLPHGYPVGEVLPVVIAGATPAAYNGVFSATVVNTTTLTYPLVSNPGAATVMGSVVVEDEQELVAMAMTFFGQGSAVAFYVLELGAGVPADGVAALSTWIIANPDTIYSYLVPRAWAGEATFYAYLASDEAPTARTYFFVTMTNSNYTAFNKLEKCVVGLIETPGIPVTEFSIAMGFYKTLNLNPSTTNKVTPLAFSYGFGVTPYPTKGNAALLATYKAAFVNVIGTGAEGGISNALFLWGTTMDGNDFSYWYSVDWVEINVDLDTSNEIINGSNNPVNPLYYSQDGINRLQARAQGTMSRGVTYGLVQPPATVNAVPFVTYTQTNISDYPAGVYNGLSVTYTPVRGFLSITFNVVVTGFIAS